MSNWKVAFTIAGREIRERSRSRAFKIASGLTLLIVVALILVPSALDDPTTEYTVGSVGDGNEAIVTTAETIANANDEPNEPPSVEMTIETYADEAAGEAAVEDGEIDALLVDGDTVIVESTGSFGNSLVSLLQRAASTVELEQLVAETGETATEVIEVMTTDSLETVSLAGDADDQGDSPLLAYAGMFLLYIAILVYGTWILGGVTEEKTNRVVEVLLSSVKPWQLLAGKILGIGALGLAQFGATIIAAAIAISITGVLDIPEIPLASFANLILWFMLGFLIYAVLFATAGSLASRMEDAQSTSLPITMIAVAAFLLAAVSLENPSGTVALIGTFIPFTAPFVVPVRVALDAIPIWQYIASIAIVVVTILVLIRLAGRIYAGGLLQYTGRVRVGQAWRAADQ